MTELQVDLDDEERRVLQVLTEAGRPLEIVELASAALLSISEAQKIVKQLIDKGVAGAVEPEPIRQRVEIDEQRERIEAMLRTPYVCRGGQCTLWDRVRERWLGR